MRPVGTGFFPQFFLSRVRGGHSGERATFRVATWLHLERQRKMAGSQSTLSRAGSAQNGFLIISHRSRAHRLRYSGNACAERERAERLFELITRFG